MNLDYHEILLKRSLTKTLFRDILTEVLKSSKVEEEDMSKNTHSGRIGQKIAQKLDEIKVRLYLNPVVIRVLYGKAEYEKMRRYL